jgi:hypothetical protein
MSCLISNGMRLIIFLILFLKYTFELKICKNIFFKYLVSNHISSLQYFFQIFQWRFKLSATLSIFAACPLLPHPPLFILFHLIRQKLPYKMLKSHLKSNPLNNSVYTFSNFCFVYLCLHFPHKQNLINLIIDFNKRFVFLFFQYPQSIKVMKWNIFILFYINTPILSKKLK